MRRFKGKAALVTGTGLRHSLPQRRKLGEGQGRDAPRRVVSRLLGFGTTSATRSGVRDALLRLVGAKPVSARLPRPR